ncbi:MAG: acetyl-CoA C-acetyltransferase [Deltaproteobacteria bacterium]|nr:acetyl-CoA C-acetyltransferase [Deltaproteobacteria bacterium]
MKNSNDCVIVAMGRSAIADFGGSLKSVRAHQLGAQVIKGVLARIPDFDTSLLDDVILGDCVQCPDEANTARTTALAAGIPQEVPAVTIQRQCSSAMEAMALASSMIRVGDAELVLTGGVESMSNAFYCLPQARWGARLQHGQMMDSMWELLHSGSNLLDKPGYIMGQTAENLARKYDISREAQDEIALRSHQNAENAIKSGRFKDEIIPIEVPQRKKDPIIFDTDEHVRIGLQMSDLTRLKPVFAKDGTVTAGNASGLNDGAAIVLLASRKKAEELGLPVIGKVAAYAAAGCDPKIMGWGPVPSTQKLLAKSGVELKDIELIELNEAFAAQYLACEQGLGLNREITNVNGSGIGLGHPVGCTGARIVVSLLNEMKRRDLNLGLATLCVGGGMGMSMLIENE